MAQKKRRKRRSINVMTINDAVIYLSAAEYGLLLFLAFRADDNNTIQIDSALLGEYAAIRKKSVRSSENALYKATSMGFCRRISRGVYMINPDIIMCAKVEKNYESVLNAYRLL